jgi:hypothetical protein
LDDQPSNHKRYHWLTFATILLKKHGQAVSPNWITVSAIPVLPDRLLNLQNQGSIFIYERNYTFEVVMDNKNTHSPEQYRKVYLTFYIVYFTI